MLNNPYNNSLRGPYLAYTLSGGSRNSHPKSESTYSLDLVLVFLIPDKYEIFATGHLSNDNHSICFVFLDKPKADIFIVSQDKNNLELSFFVQLIKKTYKT